MIGAIKDYLIEIIDAIGYLGVFITMTLSSCLIPIPSEVVLPLTGALSYEGKMNVHLAVWVATAGNMVGSLIAYWIGIKINEKKLVELINRWGKFILVSEHEYNIARKWVKKYGNGVSFFGRLIPGIRTIVSLPAGVVGVKLVPFVLYSFAGSVVWNYILAFLGYKFGEKWEDLEVYFEKFDIAILVLMVLAVGFYVYKKISGRSAKNATKRARKEA
ncbi:DedA family protein [Candidatus Dojkabacteria bacterium]|nr:DedA family protein [Candidatus Dojkabacteria bacterium]